jgi:hypothetical protein
VGLACTESEVPIPTLLIVTEFPSTWNKVTSISGRSGSYTLCAEADGGNVTCNLAPQLNNQSDGIGMKSKIKI